MSKVQTEDWDTKRLGEIFRLQTKSVFPAAHPECEFLHHSLPAYDETKGPKRELGRQIESNKTVVGKPSILVSKLNPRIPRVSLVKAVPSNECHCSSTEFMVYEPVSNLVDLGYFYRVFSSEDFRRRLTETATGTTGSRTRTHPRETLLWEVRVPPLAEQRRIAEILDTVDEVIRSTVLQIAKLEQTNQGLLHDLLTCGIDGGGRLRDPRRNPGNFIESPLGLIPRSWRTEFVRDVTLAITDGDHHTPRKSFTGIPLLGAGNVQNGFLDLSNGEYVDESEYARMIQRCHPEADDILVSCSGSIGRVARVPMGLRLALVRSVALLKVDPGKCTAEFLETALRSPILQRQIKNAQKQAAQPNLFQGAISELIIPVPELSEQEAITQSVLGCETANKVARRELSKIRVVKQGLMADLLTGLVRVGA